MTLSSKKTQATPISIQKQLHQEGCFPYYRLESIKRFLPSARQNKMKKEGKPLPQRQKSGFSPSRNPRLGRTQAFPMKKNKSRVFSFNKNPSVTYPLES